MNRARTGQYKNDNNNNNKVPDTMLLYIIHFGTYKYYGLPSVVVVVVVVFFFPYNNADDTRSRNRRQKLAPETGVGFWRQFFTPVAKFLAPETNTDE